MTSLVVVLVSPAFSLLISAALETGAPTRDGEREREIERERERQRQRERERERERERARDKDRKHRHTDTHAYTHTYIHAYIHLRINIYIYIHTHTCIITLHYITLHYITLHYITLHYITLHYIAYIELFLYNTHTHARVDGMFMRPSRIGQRFLFTDRVFCWAGSSATRSSVPHFCSTRSSVRQKFHRSRVLTLCGAWVGLVRYGARLGFSKPQTCKNALQSISRFIYIYIYIYTYVGRVGDGDKKV